MNMKNYSPSDFRSLFQHRFDLARWQGVLVDFFGATKLRERPEAVKLPPSEKDTKGFLLGELVTSDGVRIGLFRYTVPALQVERTSTVAIPASGRTGFAIIEASPTISPSPSISKNIG